MRKPKFYAGRLYSSSKVSWQFGIGVSADPGVQHVIGWRFGVALNFGPWYVEVEFEGNVKH